MLQDSVLCPRDCSLMVNRFLGRVKASFHVFVLIFM